MSLQASGSLRAYVAATTEEPPVGEVLHNVLPCSRPPVSERRSRHKIETEINLTEPAIVAEKAAEHHLEHRQVLCAGAIRESGARHWRG